MIDVTTLVKYQEEDKKLRDISKKITSNDDVAKYKKIKDTITKAKKLIAEIEEQASVVVAKYETASVNYEKAIKQFEALEAKLANVKEDDEKGRKEILDKLMVFKDNLRKLEKGVAGYKQKADELIEKYKKTTQSGQKYRAEGKELEEKVKQVKASYDADIKSIQGELKKISAKIDKDLLLKYNQLKEDGKFPAIVPASFVGNDVYCLCSMEVGPKAVNDIKDSAKGLGTCENCKRLVYKGE